MVRRAGARPGDLLQVSGPIGDGFLGLKAAKGELDLPSTQCDVLIWRYETPMPRLDVSLAGANAAADISDGLVADVGHIAEASGVAIEIDLDTLPLSHAAEDWLSLQPDRAAALVALATGGDDYELAVTAPRVLPGFAVVGRVTEGEGTRVSCGGKRLVLDRTGWRHGNQG
jgi:thiamine-monophosphate kinase